MHIITRLDMGGSAQNTLLTCRELRDGSAVWPRPGIRCDGGRTQPVGSGEAGSGEAWRQIHPSRVTGALDSSGAGRRGVADAALAHPAGEARYRSHPHLQGRYPRAAGARIAGVSHIRYLSEE